MSQKRFYRQASVAEIPEGFTILLDGKPLKTPLHSDFIVPHRRLAEAVAEEWNAQKDKINPASMLLTRFVNSIVDGVARKMHDVRRDVLNYAQSDLLFYRAEAPDELYERQARAYDPILGWLRVRGIDFKATRGIMPIRQQPESLEAFHGALIPYEPFTLAAIASMTSLTGSACLSLAVAEDYLSAEAAWDAAHIDEDFQSERWGRDDEALNRRAEKWKEMEAAARLLALVKEPA
jgi:chaperone required for assembly of F1-ATPase